MRQSFWSYLSDDWRKNGRRYLIEGTILAVVVVGCVYAVRKPYVDPQVEAQAQFHRLMADLCFAESDFMDRRAADCRLWDQRGVSWDDESEEAENLKVCPYPWDTPRTESWADQAAVWERAATKGRKTAERHARASGWTTAEWVVGHYEVAPPGDARWFGGHYKLPDYK